MNINHGYVYVPAEELSKKSYRKWRTRTQTLLDAADLLGVVTDTAALTDKNAPTESDHEIWTKDRKAFNIIMGQLHHRDSDMVISNPALQNSARTLWVHLYRRYGDVKPLQVNKAWFQFYECGMELKTPNLLVDLSAAIAQLEAAGQATDIVQCRMFVLSMFPSSHQSLKERLINKEPSPTLDQILSHLKTAIQACREPVSTPVGSANPARKDADKAHSSQNSSEHNYHRETSSFIKRLPDRPKNCQLSTPGSSNALNKEKPLGNPMLPLANNQEPKHFPCDEAQPHYLSSPSDIPRKSKDVETCQSAKTSKESVNEPKIPTQTSSSGMSGSSAVVTAPKESNKDVESSSKKFDSQKDVTPDNKNDVKPDILKDAKPAIQKDMKPDISKDGKSEIQKDLQNDVQKEVKADIKKEFEHNFKKEDSSNTVHVYTEEVTSSCAAQKPLTSAHPRTKLDQKPTAFELNERQLLHDQTSQKDSRAPQRGMSENVDSFDAHARPKTNKVHESHSPSAPYIKPGTTEYEKWTMEYLRYILQNHLPRLVVHYKIDKHGLLDLFKKHYIDGEPVDVQKFEYDHHFYNNSKRGVVPVIPGPRRERVDAWRAAVQLLNPSRVLPDKMNIEALKKVYEEEGGNQQL